MTHFLNLVYHVVVRDSAVISSFMVGVRVYFILFREKLFSFDGWMFGESYIVTYVRVCAVHITHTRSVIGYLLEIVSSEENLQERILSASQ